MLSVLHMSASVLVSLRHTMKKDHVHDHTKQAYTVLWFLGVHQGVDYTPFLAATLYVKSKFT